MPISTASRSRNHQRGDQNSAARQRLQTCWMMKKRRHRRRKAAEVMIDQYAFHRR